MKSAPSLLNIRLFVAFISLWLSCKLIAAPVQVTSGSGGLNVPNNSEGVVYSGTAGTYSVNQWNPALNGFLWNGVDFTSGETHGILNLTSNKQNWNIVSINNDMIFDAGVGGLEISGWGTNLRGNVLTLRGNGSTIEFGGAIQSNQSNAGLIVESGVANLIVGGPINTEGGDVDIFGNGSATLTGVNLDGGNYTVYGDRNITYASSSFKTEGGNISILGDGDHTFNGPVELGGGDLIWSGNGGGEFNNNLKSQGGDMDFSGSGDFTFSLIETGGGDFNWTGTGDALFENNLTANGGNINFLGQGELTFNNPVTTTTISGNITIGGNQIVDFQNNLSTNGGSITIEGNAQVNADNPITTGGGSFTITGSGGLTAANNIQTGGGDILIETSGDVETNGNVQTNGGSITVTGTGGTFFNAYVNTNDGDIILDGSGDTTFSSDPNLGNGQIIIKGSGTLIFEDGPNNTRFDVLLDGGIFNTAGDERFIDTMTLSQSSTINLGTSGGSLLDVLVLDKIDNFNPYDGSSQILIDNFSLNSVVDDDLILFASNSGVNGNEGLFRFRGDFGDGYGIYFATIQNHYSGGLSMLPGALDYNIVPVPEPSTLIYAFLLVVGGPILLRLRNRRKSE